MDAAGLVLLVMTLLSTGYGVFAAYCTWDFFRARKNRPKQILTMPPVSIVKPVARVEEDSFENFASFCRQDYPAFELLFAFPPKGDSLIALLNRLKAHFPDSDIDWVIADPGRGPNYKVGNLIPAVEKAKHSVLVISDSDMRVGPEYLRETVSAFLQEKVGLVTTLYRNIHPGSFFAALQALTVQTTFIPNVLFSRRVEGIRYAFGATLCTSKEILASVGGMPALLDYLADDFQLACRILEKGYRICLSSLMVDQVSHVKTFREYFLQQLRAGITQRVCRPLGYFGSIVTHQTTLALLFAVVERFSVFSVSLLLIICGIRILGALLLDKTTIHNRELRRYFLWIPFNDLLNSLLWLLSLFTDRVRWKDRRFRVLKGGRMVEWEKPERRMPDRSVRSD